MKKEEKKILNNVLGNWLIKNKKTFISLAGGYIDLQDINYLETKAFTSYEILPTDKSAEYFMHKIRTENTLNIAKDLIKENSEIEKILIKNIKIEKESSFLNYILFVQNMLQKKDNVDIVTDILWNKKSTSIMTFLEDFAAKRQNQYNPFNKYMYAIKTDLFILSLLDIINSPNNNKDVLINKCFDGIDNENKNQMLEMFPNLKSKLSEVGKRKFKMNLEKGINKNIIIFDFNVKEFTDYVNINTKQNYNLIQYYLTMLGNIKDIDMFEIEKLELTNLNKIEVTTNKKEEDVRKILNCAIKILAEDLINEKLESSSYKSIFLNKVKSTFNMLNINHLIENKEENITNKKNNKI